MKRPTLLECEEFHNEFTTANGNRLSKADLPAIFRLGLNTYAHGLRGFSLEQIPEMFFMPHLIADLDSAEIAEDVFEDPSLQSDFYRGIPRKNFGDSPPPRIKWAVEKILETADKYGIHLDSIGTGAFLYKRVLQGDNLNSLGERGFFDLDNKEQKERMAVFENWINIASMLGVQIIAGHRIATNDPDKYNQEGRLEEFADSFKFDIGDLNPNTSISLGEALNIDLFIRLQKYNPDITNTTELMYQHKGISPITVEQIHRMAYLIELNGPSKVFAHMDIGHVIVQKENGNTKQKRDFDLLRYANDAVWPRWIDHFNNIYYNRHDLPTREGLSNNVDAQTHQSTPKVPYPDLHLRHVYKDWLKVNMYRCQVHQLTLEPKDVGNLSQLGLNAREVKELLTEELAETHVTDPRFKGYYIPKAMYDGFVEKFSS